MTKEQFDYACSTYGDPNLSSEDKWKSVFYFSTDTTKMPTFSVQHYLKTSQIRYSENIGEPGFFITDYQPAQSGVFSNKRGMITTFIPLSKITSVSITDKSTKETPGGGGDKPSYVNTIVDGQGAEESSDVYEYIISMDDNAASDDSEYIRIYDGTSANVVEGEEPAQETVVMDGSNVLGE